VRFQVANAALVPVGQPEKALSWELATTLSVARVRQRRSRYAEASAILGGRFSEGLDTTYLRLASHTLNTVCACFFIPRRLLGSVQYAHE
jgi:hypothetical protein